MRTIVDMNEFLLWSNCSNNCKFCWQKKISNPSCLLTEEEKVLAIKRTMERIDSLDYGDVLIVGGEAFEHSSDEVTSMMKSLFSLLYSRCSHDRIRYLYINTNLIYRNMEIIDYICELFRTVADKLKFTTSYDVYGRYATEEKRELFLSNLRGITTNYPHINIVVNTILTRQVCESDFSAEKFKEEYGVRMVNLIPYIPISQGDEMTPTLGQIINKLMEADKENEGYFRRYIENFDLDQEKILWEYHKDTNDYVECTSEYDECGHNRNFRKVLESGECFICKLKEIYLDLKGDY